MIRKIIMLFFLLFSFVTVFFGQDKQITNEKHKFALTSPTGLSAYEDGNTVLEFRGTEKNYGVDSLFFLKSVMPINISPIEKLEVFMKEAATIENMDKDLINSMRISFPDTTSIEKSFIYFNERPTIQGTYSFSVRNIPMKGRYMLVLIKEQSAIYVFSWASKTNIYERWNKSSENTVKSLKIK